MASLVDDPPTYACLKTGKKHLIAILAFLILAFIGTLLLALASPDAGRPRMLSYFFGTLTLDLAIIVPAFVWLTSTVNELKCQEETVIVVES